MSTIWKKEEKTIENDPRYDEIEQLVWEFFMNKIPELGFESREGQEDMALDICAAIKDHQHTIVEAGVGIGKSYAYIVPLLYYNKLFQKPVVIATSTIALQEQLIKDIRKVANYIDYRPEMVLAKGMTHFACRNRAEKYVQQLPKEQMDETTEMLYQYIQVRQVERKNINLDIPDELWDEVNVRMTDHNKCRYFGSCRFMELRNNMMNCSGVIICNQDLLTVHFQKIRRGEKGLINENADLIVIDEAHNLEEKVRSSLMKSYTLGKIDRLLEEASSSIEHKGMKPKAVGLRKEAMAILRSLFAQLNEQIQTQLKRDHHSESMEKFFIDYGNVKSLIIVLRQKVKSIYEMVQLYSGDDVMSDTIEGLLELQRFLGNMGKEKGRELYWLERNKGVEVFSCPKDIDQEIRQLYFDKLKTTILTSATLADKHEGTEEERYEYLVKTIGFPVEEGFLAPQKYSPFPYDEHAMVYYTEDLPHPTEERSRFIHQAIEEIVRLLDVTQGKALILFTAKQDLQQVYQLLKERNLGYPLLRQRAMSSQDELVEQFKSQENAVLLATGTFWEGIDLPGKVLSNVIIFRLPFPVPDPILDYKKSISEDFFMEVSLPLMIVKLRQGVGRLIRKQDDKGIVAIIDPRLGDGAKNRYKEMVFQALPMKRKTNDIQVIRKFWAKMETGN